MSPLQDAGEYPDVAPRLDHRVERPGEAGPAAFQLGSIRVEGAGERFDLNWAL